MSCFEFRRAAAHAVALAVAVSLITGLAGCFGGAPIDEKNVTDRVPVSGTVEFDGQPIVAGTVTFMNQKTGNMAVCQIDDGYYESESDQGANPGLNTVIVEAKEDEDADPMWAQSWTTQVEVGKEEHTEEFKIGKLEVQPFDPAANARPVDTDD